MSIRVALRAWRRVRSRAALRVSVFLFFGITWIVPAAAHAQWDTRRRPTFLSFGPLVTVAEPPVATSTTPPWIGVGAEVSLHHYTVLPAAHSSGQNSLPLPDWWAGLAFGAFAQVEEVDLRAFRGSLGAQMSWLIFGGELACSVQTPDAPVQGFVSVRPGVYVSFAFVSAVFRVDLPLVSYGVGNSPGPFVSFAVTLKLPVNVTPGSAWNMWH